MSRASWAAIRQSQNRGVIFLLAVMVLTLHTIVAISVGGLDGVVIIVAGFCVVGLFPTAYNLGRRSARPTRETRNDA